MRHRRYYEPLPLSGKLFPQGHDIGDAEATDRPPADISGDQAVDLIFALGRVAIGKGGVVRDAALHDEVCARIRTWLAESMGWQVAGVSESPITGPKGNVEFLICARKDPSAPVSPIVKQPQ